MMPNGSGKGYTHNLMLYDQPTLLVPMGSFDLFYDETLNVAAKIKD